MAKTNLLTARKFWPLFWTQLLSALNDNFLKNSLVMLIAYKSLTIWALSAEKMVALCGAIFIFPFFLFSATAGQIADKFEKSKLIKIIKFIEILLMLLAGYGFIAEKYELLIVDLFLMGLHSTFFGPLKYSILPQLLKENELVEANALVESGTFLAILIGTIGGGVLIRMQPQGAWIVASGLFLMAVLGWCTSLLIQKAPSKSPQLKISKEPFSPTFEIYKYTTQNRPVYLSVLGISWFWFFGAAILSLLPSYTKIILSGDGNIMTLFLSIFTIGIGVGSLICGKLSFERLELGLVPFGSIGITLFTLDLFLVGRPYGAAVDVGIYQFLNLGGLRIIVDLFFLSVFSGLMIVPLYTMIQQRSELSHRSRIIAANNILNALFMVASSVMIMGFYSAGISIPEMFLIFALMNAVVAAYIYLSIPEFLLRFLAWILVRILYRLKTIDLDKIPKEGPVLLVCNHVTFVDWLIIGGAIKRPIRFVMDYSFMKIFLFRYFLKQGKVIPIAKKEQDPKILSDAFDRVAEELQAGEVVCIFPEGTLTKTGEMNPFRPGVEKILKRTPVPVVPLALIGMWGSFFSHKDGAFRTRKPEPFWYRVTLKAAEPVPPERATAENLYSIVHKAVEGK